MTTVIITGASSGIGEALARECHRRGYAVGMVARRAERLEAIKRDLGERCEVAIADVRQRDETAGAIGKLEAALGPCDVLIANAGIASNNAAFRFEYDDFNRVMQTNVFGVIHSVEPVLKSMIDRSSGHLVVVSSMAAFRGLPRLGAYCASKSAVSTLFESWRFDLRRNKIHLTAVHPGYVETPILKGHDKVKKPFLMNVSLAASTIVDGIERRKLTITFPWQMKLILGFARLLPSTWYVRFASRFL